MLVLFCLKIVLILSHLCKRVIEALFIVIDCFIFIIVKWLHLHSDAEGAAMANSIRLNSDCATARLDNLLDHVEAEPQTFTVYHGSALKFSEPCE